MVWDFTDNSFIRPGRIFASTTLFCIFLSSLRVSAQYAELTVNVFDPLNNPASGLVSVSGPDTSAERELVNGTAFFLLDGITAKEDIDRDDMNFLYPNPVGTDGRVLLVIPSFDGRIEVFNAFGRKIFEGSAGDMEMSFPFDPGMGIILYTSADGERAVFKVVNPASHRLSLTIKNQEPSHVKNTMAVDGYYIVYQDPWQDLEEISSTRIIYPGTFFTENFRPPYSMKSATVMGKTSGLSLILVKNPADEIIGFFETGTDGIINPFFVTDAFSKNTGEDISVEISGYNADTLIFAEHINQADTISINRLLNRRYSVKVNCSTLGFGFTVSDKDGFLGSGNSQTYFKKEADSLYVDIIGSASGYKTSRLYDVLIRPGISWCTMSLTLADSIFQHLFTVNLSSSEATEGHSILNPFVDITTSIGTNRKAFTNGKVAYAWDSDMKNEIVTYDIGLQGTGHKDLPATSLSVGITPVVVTRVAEANDFTGNITFNIKDSKTGLNLNGATITTSQSKTGTTNTSGNAILSGYAIDENAYSEAINTAITYAISRTNYIDTTGTISILAGEYTSNLKLRPVPTYAHSLRVNLISDEAIVGHKVKDSLVIFTTSQGDTTLSTNNQTVTYSWNSKLQTENVTYDIIVAGDGHADSLDAAVIVGNVLVTRNVILHANDFTGDLTFNVKDSQTDTIIIGADITTSQGRNDTTDASGNAVFTGYIIDENEFSEAISTKIGYTIEQTDYYTKTDTANILSGTNTVSETLIPLSAPIHPHSLTVKLISDEAGVLHKVKDSPVTFTTSLGDVMRTTVNQTVTYTWNSTVETENVRFDINVAGAGHADSLGVLVSVGADLVTRNITLKGNDYTGNLTLNVKDRQTNLDITGASVITSQSKSGTTDASGNVTLTGYIIDENEYSEAISTPVNDTIECTGYVTETGTINIFAGNNTINVTLVPGGAAYSHSLTVNLISEEFAEVHKVHDSPITFITSIGDSTITTINQTITYTWTSGTENENVEYDIIVTGGGHADSLDATIMVGTSPVSRNDTLFANDYTGNIAFNVKDGEGVNVEGATISTVPVKSGTTDGSGNLTLSGYVINEDEYSQPKITNITYTVEKTGYITKNGTAAINAGANGVNEVLPLSYPHTLTIKLASDEAGHLVKDSPIDFVTSLGSVTHTTTEQTYTYTWTSALATERVTYSITVAGGGHSNVVNASVDVGTTPVTETATLAGKDYTGGIVFWVKDNTSTGINGALITTDQSRSGLTASDGGITIVDYIINENTFSEPDTTTIHYIITATGYTTENGWVNIIPGLVTVNETLVAE